ncbi:MAG: DUF6005 family protein [Pseudomonadales bacterium]|uniref:Acyl carrier protein n=1 Tax=Oleiphilus messinensis TaxID=141451 RepID=A0A1Y0I2L0_9GAMM|nr:DUF6005 family protein [Oleiphilus messinensis]ARU54641.1 acyl carrier protein [Oleiphilus messinensis]MCG8609513.1 DUF6005 family protein [Pseudomonadales bacterium]
MMTKQQIVDSIYKVLSEKMNLSDLSAFQSDARLIEDLALDSSMVLQMLMFLELDCGLEIPDSALMNKDFETVRSVAKVLYESQDLPKVDKGLEVYEDVKIHCVASCLSEIVKRNPALDHRILYFGVWDAEFCINDQYVLSYHSNTISHAFFVDWYEKLYGMKVRRWYRPDATKDENIQELVKLVENRTPDQHIMVMLDMYHLPERVNEFNKDPFPHYLMLGPSKNPDQWMVYDPDYRWEGIASKERILNAVRQPTVAGGYVFSDANARVSPPEQIKGYFEASVYLDHNPVTDLLRKIVSAHLKGVDRNGDPLPLANLGKALEEVPVLSPRKYGYEHGFAFFWRELLLPEEEFDQWCDVIDELAKAYKLVQFQAMKLSATQNRDLSGKLFELLDAQDEREFRLKKRLNEVFLLWCEAVFDSSKSPTAAGGVE